MHKPLAFNDFANIIYSYEGPEVNIIIHVHPTSIVLLVDKTFVYLYAAPYE